MEKKNSKKEEKVTIELGEKANQQINELKKDFGTVSGAQVVENSLNLMKTLKEEVKCGSEIIIENKNERKRILFL